MKKNSKIGSVAIVGPGRIGQALGRLLADSGVRVDFVAARKLSSARRAAKFIGQGTPVEIANPNLLNASVVLITTSDSSIAEVGRALSRIGTGRNAWRGKIVLHTCGSLPSSVLRPLKMRGAAVGSLHPYQTVPTPMAGIHGLRGCYWSVEGDRKAVAAAKDLVRRLDGKSFTIRPEQKAFYHVSAFLVCPMVVTLMAQAEEMLGNAGVSIMISRPMLRQFVAETAKNFAQLGGRRALTGPVVRGDWATVQRHRRALRKAAPEFVPAYDELLAAMLRLARKPAAKRRRV